MKHERQASPEMTSLSKIVVGYDGSESSRRALDRAAALTGYGSQLTVVSVARKPRDLEGSRRLLSDASERLLRSRAFAQLDERVGDPADEVAAATERQADLLIVGTGKNALQRLLLGSVSTELVHRSPCDVLVARSGPPHGDRSRFRRYVGSSERAWCDTELRPDWAWNWFRSASPPLRAEGSTALSYRPLADASHVPARPGWQASRQ